jgi:hypothetical protein
VVYIIYMEMAISSPLVHTITITVARRGLGLQPVQLMRIFVTAIARIGILVIGYIGGVTHGGVGRGETCPVR